MAIKFNEDAYPPGKINLAPSFLKDLNLVEAGAPRITING